MKTEIIQHLQTQALGAYSVSTDLPWTSNGEPLYQLNPKVIYVDEPQTDQEVIVQVLNGSDVMKTTTTIGVFVVNDAKTLPTDYDTVKTVLLGTKDTSLISNAYDRECDISTSYDDDVIITSVLYRFTTIT
jgi:hypothetical protein